MSTDAIRDVLDLPINERLRFVQEIWDSITQTPVLIPLTGAEKRELDRRLEAYKRDPESGRPWDEVKSSLLGET